MSDDYFIAIYTNKVKEYCDKIFIDRVHDLSKGNQVHIVDNTIGTVYFNKLNELCKSYKNFSVYHIDVPKEPKRTQFLRNVEQSVNYLRNIFLQTDSNNFLVVESDVLPPVDLLDKFSNNSPPGEFGILGALYYKGFHDYKKTGLNKSQHILSGCTVYKRNLIEKYPFRWDSKNMNAFPDAWICMDSGKEFSFYNNHDIHCEHLHNSNGTRYSSQL